MNAAAARSTILGMAVFSASAPVVSARDFYQGKLFLATFLALALAVTLTPILIWWAEKRMAGRPFWQVLLACVGLPMFVVGGILLTLGPLHSVRNRAVFGAPEAFPAIRSLIPVVLVATLAYVIIQLRTSRRRRLASAAIWFIVAVVATQAWVLRVSLDNPYLPGLWNWDEAALQQRLPLVILLPIAGATLGLFVRLGKLHRALRLEAL